MMPSIDYEKILNDAIRITGNTIADKLEDELMLKGISDYYDRTGDVINALRNPPKIKITGSDISGEVINIRLIRPVRALVKGKFNSHMSFGGKTRWRGHYVPEQVPEWLDEGFHIRGKEVKGLNYVNGALKMSVDEYITDLVAEMIVEYVNKVKSFSG